MKINFLLPHLKLSGGVHVTMTFADLLARRGHQVIVAVEDKSMKRYLRIFFSAHHRLLPNNSAVKIIKVKDFAKLPEADVFFADSWKVAQKLYELNIGAATFQYLQHDERLYHGNPAEVEKVYRLPLKKFVNATWIYDALKKIGQDSVILFNAVDCELFNPDKRSRPNDDKEIKILLLHHTYGWKGTQDGISIVNDLKKKYPNAKLVLYGTRTKKIDLPYDEYYYDATGEDLARVFANSDIYLGCSIDDSRPIAHRWAMASGAALAIYDNMSVQDYASNGETALIAKKGDAQNLSQKLEEFIVNPDIRKKIANNALAYVRDLPSWEDLTNKLENIFKEAILK